MVTEMGFCSKIRWCGGWLNVRLMTHHWLVVTEDQSMWLLNIAIPVHIEVNPFIMKIWYKKRQSMVKYFCQKFPDLKTSNWRRRRTYDICLAAFEIRPFRLSQTTRICGGQSIVTRRLSEWTANFWEGYVHMTLLFKGTYKSSDCQGWKFWLQWWASTLLGCGK